MSMLFAVCPKDGSRIETGVFADQPTRRLFSKHRILVQCDRCTGYHSMHVDELIAEQDGALHEAA